MKREFLRDVEVERYENETKQVERKMCIIRICFLLSGMCAITSSISFVSYGTYAFQVTAKKAQFGLNDAKEIVREGMNITSAFLREFNTVVVTDNYFSDEAAWCPNLANYEGDEHLTLLRGNVDNVRQSIKNLDNDFTTEMKTLHDDLINTKTGVDLMNDHLNKGIEKYSVVATTVAIFQIGIVSILMSGVAWTCVARLPKFLRSTYSYFFLPILIISTLLSIVLCASFLAASITGSDFCYPSPDLKVSKLLQTNEELFGPFVSRAMSHYVMGCHENKEVLDIEQYIPKFEDAHNTVNKFINIFPKDIQLHDKLCDGVILGITLLIDDALHDFAQRIDGARVLLSCSNINSVYAMLAHNVSCYDGINAFYWICFSQLGVAFFSMIMVTLRVSWQQVEKRKSKIILC
eukprot:CAMPEP_0172504188 /NCGR_PEP_ID=MMETSP1066-20121228/176243_1 /TAXON_ID=671091 /ORGANISM="Coscinodiscus wailesii, Strain CCMP2513" /LENGTH=405 /DNA_ID=CAMNT_0013280249 /DNA_START=495 /DNA_END=1712 /DNA_ORIENTATION=+